MAICNDHMMDASTLKIYSRLQRSAHLLKKAADKELLAVADITTAQAAVLVVVAKQAGTTQRLVAHQLGLNESAVVAMVTRLMAIGYLERSRSVVDKRAWVLSLTKAGNEVLGRIAEPFASINARIEKAVGADALSSIAKALDSLDEEFSN
ncbi:MarR family winged helix-turn-helix transcriptional regulator [Kordiimonas aquimaris]|uniref:MarR family winged helix-turn-helix transcriptional regulator n=1 Tax=Kordiimonas aquimaris TaxID=707591 RepID=UPI0021D16B22|nr:MarR family winged helix-turn-helix transcriptional regulator [Kordiimonas aquimaris]